jgi:hypothetical protein
MADLGIMVAIDEMGPLYIGTGMFYGDPLVAEIR